MALPRRIFPPLVSKTGPGQGYGTHVDDAIIGGGLALRSDVSVTVFPLRPRHLWRRRTHHRNAIWRGRSQAGGRRRHSLPSTTLHRVAPVTSGERLAAVTWIESRVRDAGRREILFDLDRAPRSIFERDGKSATFDLVTKSYSNLLRRWAEG